VASSFVTGANGWAKLFAFAHLHEPFMGYIEIQSQKLKGGSQLFMPVICFT
jgi:hypothetical protein